jgi:Domain of unknown function (DUF6766)
MRRLLRDNGLSITMFALFLVFLVAQSIAGYQATNSDNEEHRQPRESYGEYLTSGAFVEATFENWESEFLQMAAFVLLTAYLLQRGSGQSKKEREDPRDEDPRLHRNDPDAPWPVRRGGAWLYLYERSLFIAFSVLFIASFVGHAVSGAHEYSAEQHEHGDPGVGAWQFVRTAEFWFQSFQNWQSEFLAVGAIVVLTVFLRQRGSAESKPVHEPHRETGD